MARKRPSRDVRGASAAELAETALTTPAAHDDIDKRIAELDPEDARLFAAMVGVALRKRRWLLAGYLGALVAVLVGMVVALWAHGAYGGGRFIGWAFVLPALLAGLVLWLVGRHVKRMT